MTRPPEVPAPKGGCQLSRASLRQGQAPQSPAGRSQGSTSAAKRVEVQGESGPERHLPRLAAAHRPSSCFPRAPPVAGISLRQGALAPDLLCPSGRASLGPCLPARQRSAPRARPGGRSRAAHPGGERRRTTSSSKGINSRSAREEGQRTRGRKGWWRPDPAPRRSPRPGPHGPRHGRGLTVAVAVRPGRLGGRRAPTLRVGDLR